jgi:hypothetical protein
MLLKEYVPLNLYNEKTLNKTYQIQQKQLDAIENNIQDVINNCFIQTATWSLPTWESEYGIDIIESDTYEVRRSRVLAKMRSNGLVTKSMIQNLAESFSNGKVEVIEDPANYTFKIVFLNSIGIPPKVEDLYNAIEEIKPAHLLVSYEFKFTTWDELSPYTWDELSPYTWDEIRNGALTTKNTTMYSLNTDGTYNTMEFK